MQRHGVGIARRPNTRVAQRPLLAALTVVAMHRPARLAPQSARGGDTGVSRTWENADFEATAVAGARKLNRFGGEK